MKTMTIISIGNNTAIIISANASLEDARIMLATAMNRNKAK